MRDSLSTMKTLIFLLCFSFVRTTTVTLVSDSLLNKTDTTHYACLNEDALFEYNMPLDSPEITSITWTYYDQQKTKGIATYFSKEFVLTQNYLNRVTITEDGNFILQKVGVKDNGKYMLKIKIQEAGFQRVIYHHSSLVVSESVMYKGNSLVASVSDQAEWNIDNDSPTLSLTCGDFIFKNDDAPIFVEWVTPDGSVKNSTRYNDNKFYLQLDNPINHGQYTCRIPKESLKDVCATNKDNTEAVVKIEEKETQVLLMKSQISKLSKELHEVESKDSALVEKIAMLDMKFHEVEETEQNQTSCEDWIGTRSGKRKIHLPNKQRPVEIYCDQATDGGRWNVFQRRIDGSVDFYRGWSDYREGFGDPEREFWLGLEALHQMTSDGRTYELRFDLMKQDGSRYYAHYDNFVIASESRGYAISFNGYRGNAGNSFNIHNNCKFTTKDRDLDFWNGVNCAAVSQGGFWYRNCGLVNINGHYNDGRYGKGLAWSQLTTLYGSLQETEMKFRLKH